MGERKVITSLVLSLAVHAGGLGTLALVGTRSVEGAGTVSQLGLPAGFELALNAPAIKPVFNPTLPPLPEPEPVKPPELRAPEQMPLPELEEPEVPLGIEDSEAESKVWKGSKEATENLAPKSEVDQAARSMDPKAGSKGESQQPAAAAAGLASQPSPATIATPQVAPAEPSKSEPSEPGEAEAVQAQPLPEQAKPVQDLPKQEREQQFEPEQLQKEQKEQTQPQQLQAPVPGPAETGPANVELQLPKAQPKDVQPAAVQPLPVQEKPQQDASQQLQEQQLTPEQLVPQKDGAAEGSANEKLPENPAVQPSQPTNPVSAAPPAAPSGVAKAALSEPDPGRKADEESTAAAIVGSLVYKPGEPLAGKGLKVSTVRPRYGFATMAVANPRDVVVHITFGRDGRVLRAVFKDGKGTGFEDVDKPLIEAVYRWTAKGEALTKIPAGKPNAGVTFAIKFLWGTDAP